MRQLSFFTSRDLVDERTASSEIGLKLYHARRLGAGRQHLIAEAPYFVLFNFDGDWDGFNNTENITDADSKGFNLGGYVYYGVQETQAHFYIHYAYFHATDPKSPLVMRMTWRARRL